MKTIFNLFIILCCVIVVPACAQEGQKAIVAPEGETVINANSAQVKIITRKIDIGKPSDRLPKVKRLSCTYSRYPCSIIEDIDILVNGQPLVIPVPHSVYCDRSDVNNAYLKYDNGIWILTFYGGDASESYIAKITFDKSRVLKREIFSAASPDEALQETIYNTVIVGD